MVSFILWYLTIASLLKLQNCVAPQTLSLQGNVVNNPTKSTKQTAPNLKECARICMDRPLCGMFVYNTNNKICEIATHFTATLTRNLNQFELAYRRGTSCAPTRQMTLHTRKIGKFYSKQVGHRFMGPLVKEIIGMERQGLDFCYAMYDVPECEMVLFGSADNGKSLTRDKNTPGFVRMGFCAANYSSCNAGWIIKEFRSDWPVANNFMYAADVNDQPKSSKVQERVFCYFWGVQQCPKGMTTPITVVLRTIFRDVIWYHLGVRMEGYVQYGYCAAGQGTCNAYHAVSEFIEIRPRKDNRYYAYWPNSPRNVKETTPHFCFFWNGTQCSQGTSSAAFEYTFKMGF